MKLLIVLLNYHVTDLTIDCLRSIEPEVPSVPGMKVAICENGSGGDAELRLRTAIDVNGWAEWAELTAVTPNLGFTGGNNHIIRRWLAASECPDYFLLLNADTLLTQGALQSLVQFMDSHPKVGIAGSRLDNPDGSRNGSPFRFHGILTEFDRGMRLGIVSKLISPWSVLMPIPAKPAPVDWVCGASMIIRREVIKSIGPLDEGYYTYFDDTDYCLNAKRAGWPTWYVPESRIIHIEGASTGVAARNISRRPEYLFMARRRYYLKNHGSVYAALVDAAYLIGFAVWRVRRRIQRKPDVDPPHMLLDAFANSVFLTGFKLRDVENPALKGATIDQTPGAHRVTAVVTTPDRRV
jgi:GT2 family glycosyltransferase